MGDRGFESSSSGGETVANLTSSIRVDPGRMAPGLAGLRGGAFWEPGDPALLDGYRGKRLQPSTSTYYRPDDATDSGSDPATISPQPGPPRVSSMSAPFWMLASNTA